MNRDQADFQRQTLALLYQCLAQGRTDELVSLGLDFEAMRLIRSIPILDLPHSALRAIKRVEVDVEALTDLARRANESQAINDCIDDLLQQGATTKLLHHFFGLHKQDVALRRRLLGLPLSAGGRPRNDTARLSERAILKAVCAERGLLETSDRGQSIAQCRALMRTAATLRRPISEIWVVIERAELCGQFHWIS